MKLLKLLFSTLVFFVFTSCEKASEEVEKHENSHPHNSLSSETFTVTPGDWSGDGNGYESVKFTSIITQEVMESGAVFCYLKIDDGYIQLPYTVSTGTDSFTQHYLYTHKAGRVTFIYFDDDGATLRPTENLEFKVVAMEEFQKVDIDFGNYKEVKNALELE